MAKQQTWSEYFAGKAREYGLAATIIAGGAGVHQAAAAEPVTEYPKAKMATIKKVNEPLVGIVNNNAYVGVDRDNHNARITDMHSIGITANLEKINKNFDLYNRLSSELSFVKANAVNKEQIDGILKNFVELDKWNEEVKRLNDAVIKIPQEQKTKNENFQEQIFELYKKLETGTAENNKKLLAAKSNFEWLENKNDLHEQQICEIFHELWKMQEAAKEKNADIRDLKSQVEYLNKHNEQHDKNDDYLKYLLFGLGALGAGAALHGAHRRNKLTKQIASLEKQNQNLKGEMDSVSDKLQKIKAPAKEENADTLKTEEAKPQTSENAPDESKEEQTVSEPHKEAVHEEQSKQAPSAEEHKEEPAAQVEEPPYAPQTANQDNAARIGELAGIIHENEPKAKGLRYEAQNLGLFPLGAFRKKDVAEKIAQAEECEKIVREAAAELKSLKEKDPKADQNLFDKRTEELRREPWAVQAAEIVREDRDSMFENMYGMYPQPAVSGSRGHEVRKPTGTVRANDVHGVQETGVWQSKNTSAPKKTKRMSSVQPEQYAQPIIDEPSYAPQPRPRKSAHGTRKAMPDDYTAADNVIEQRNSMAPQSDEYLVLDGQESKIKSKSNSAAEHRNELAIEYLHAEAYRNLQKQNGQPTEDIEQYMERLAQLHANVDQADSNTLEDIRRHLNGTIKNHPRLTKSSQDKYKDLLNANYVDTKTGQINAKFLERLASEGVTDIHVSAVQEYYQGADENIRRHVEDYVRPDVEQYCMQSIELQGEKRTHILPAVAGKAKSHLKDPAKSNEHNKSV